MSGLNARASNDQVRLEWPNVTSSKGGGGDAVDWAPASVFALCNFAFVAVLRAEGAICAD